MIDKSCPICGNSLKHIMVKDCETRILCTVPVSIFDTILLICPDHLTDKNKDKFIEIVKNHVSPKGHNLFKNLVKERNGSELNE